MKLTYNGLASQNGDDTPTVERIGDAGFRFETEFEKDENGDPIDGAFFFVSKGNFELGKCALIFQQSENPQDALTQIKVDHNYASPDKIRVTTWKQNSNTGHWEMRNECLRNTPFQLTVDIP